MIVATTYENELIFQHFGKSPYFKLYEVEGNKVLHSEVISVNGKGHSDLAYLLKEHNVDVLICGGLGGGAVNMLNSLHIAVLSGASGNADEIVRKYLNKELVASSEATCDHHDHEHEDGHECHCHDHEHEHDHECGCHDKK